MTVHKNIRVKGRVQGVFYRASAVDVAQSMGLYGFVVNEQDGSVYIEVEGLESNVNSMIEWAKQGPTRAQVESLDTTTGPVVGFTTFEIRR